jgi:hypothetical protein
MARSRDLLILKNQDLRDEVSGFFKALNTDESLRRVFFDNPSLVLRTRLQSLRGVDLTDQQDAQANRILFSVLSNDKFRAFLQEYQQRKTDALERLVASPGDKKAMLALDEQTIRREFAEALLRFGDTELLSNLLGRSNPTSPSGESLAWIVIFVVVFVAVAAVHAVLALGTGGDFAPTIRGRLPISASELRKIADQLVATARQARDAGELIP